MIVNRGDIKKVIWPHNVWLKFRTCCIFMIVFFSVVLSLQPSLNILREKNNGLDKDEKILHIIYQLSNCGQRKVSFFNITSIVGGDRIAHVDYDVNTNEHENEINNIKGTLFQDGWEVIKSSNKEIEMKKEDYVLRFYLNNNKISVKITAISTYWGIVIDYIYRPMILISRFISI